MATKRNYKREYKTYHKTKAGKVRKGDGKDVDHKNRNTADNRKKNLRAVPKSKNRSFKRK
jgi:hypothetical protein